LRYFPRQCAKRGLVPASGDWGAGPSQGLKGTCDIAKFLDSGDLHHGFLQNRVPMEGPFLNARRATSPTLWMRAAAGLEVLTGLALIVAPSLLGRLLFGSNLNAAGEATGRISGFVMVCLAAGCWPRASKSGRHQARFPLIALSWLAAAFLVVTGLIGSNVGSLLWPAAALHLILAVLLTWTQPST
jgi:hypothetical protein